MVDVERLRNMACSRSHHGGGDRRDEGERRHGQGNGPFALRGPPTCECKPAYMKKDHQNVRAWVFGIIGTIPSDHDIVVMWLFVLCFCRRRLRFFRSWVFLRGYSRCIAGARCIDPLKRFEIHAGLGSGTGRILNGRRRVVSLSSVGIRKKRITCSSAGKYVGSVLGVADAVLSVGARSRCSL